MEQFTKKSAEQKGRAEIKKELRLRMKQKKGTQWVPKNRRIRDFLPV